MLGFDAIGMDAVGVTSASSSQASLSCNATATATVSASLTTAVRLVAVATSAAVLTASLTTHPAGLAAYVSATASVTATLSTAVKFSASLLSNATATATLTSLAAPQQAQLQANLHAQATATCLLTTLQAAPMFTPSTARTINVMATTPVFTGGKYWNFSDAKKPRGAKDPDATIDITFNWSDWLNDIGSATISDVTFTLVGADSVGTFSDGTNATVFVSGGVDSTSASVSCKITTNTTPARTDERTIYLDIGNE